MEEILEIINADLARHRTEQDKLGAIEPAFSSRSQRNCRALAKAYFEGGDEALDQKFEELFPRDRYK